MRSSDTNARASPVLYYCDAKNIDLRQEAPWGFILTYIDYSNVSCRAFLALQCKILIIYHRASAEQQDNTKVQ
jgi:hypothetical protein